jgi:hypothetical protein
MSHEPQGIEHVQEEIQHHATHGEHDRWVAGAALTAAILAALAAITSALAGVHLTESSRAQIESNDSWGFYQAKSIKSTILTTKIELLGALGKPTSDKEQKKLGEYEDAMKKTMAMAKELTEASEHHLELHEVLERGVTLFHIAIAIVAVSVLTKRRLFWFGSIGFGLVGLFFMVTGLVPFN